MFVALGGGGRTRVFDCGGCREAGGAAALFFVCLGARGRTLPCFCFFFCARAPHIFPTSYTRKQQQNAHTHTPCACQKERLPYKYTNATSLSLSIDRRKQKGAAAAAAAGSFFGRRVCGAFCFGRFELDQHPGPANTPHTLHTHTHLLRLPTTLTTWPSGAARCSPPRLSPSRSCRRRRRGSQRQTPPRTP